MSSRTLLLGFAAGFLAVLVFHQGLWWVFNQVGIIPMSNPAWAATAIPPFEVPAWLSKAFWGGLWGMVLATLLRPLRGASYWYVWAITGAVALSLVALFIVPPLKGAAVPALWPRFFIAMALNGAWGFGTAAILRLLGAGRSA